jgi:hypothetical protein
MSENGNYDLPQDDESMMDSSLNRRSFALKAAGVAAVAGAAAVGAIGWSVTRPEGDPDVFGVTQHLSVSRLTGPLPRDPEDGKWADAPALHIMLHQQTMVAPRMQQEGMIPHIELRSLHNGEEVAFHLRWQDAQVDETEAIARFADTVAVQLPVDPSTPTAVMMGQPGRPVHILHWRANWQQAIGNGPRNARSAYPNAVNELAPEDILDKDTAITYYPALRMGNARAIRDRTTSVEEMVAEGFGTLTTHKEQRAEGHGKLSNGHWSVVIVMPMNGGQNQAKLRPGQPTRVAVAAWDGSKGDRGARKQWGNWVGLDLSS